MALEDVMDTFLPDDPAPAADDSLDIRDPSLPEPEAADDDDAEPVKETPAGDDKAGDDDDTAPESGTDTEAEDDDGKASAPAPERDARAPLIAKAIELGLGREWASKFKDPDSLELALSAFESRQAAKLDDAKPPAKPTPGQPKPPAAAPTDNPPGEQLQITNPFDEGDWDPEWKGKMGEFKNSVQTYIDKRVDQLVAERLGELPSRVDQLYQVEHQRTVANIFDRFDGWMQKLPEAMREPLGKGKTAAMVNVESPESKARNDVLERMDAIAKQYAERGQPMPDFDDLAEAALYSVLGPKIKEMTQREIGKTLDRKAAKAGVSRPPTSRSSQAPKGKQKAIASVAAKMREGRF